MLLTYRTRFRVVGNQAVEIASGGSTTFYREGAVDDSTELTYDVSLLGTLNEKLRNLKGLRTLVSELIQNADDSKGIDDTDRGATEMEFLVAAHALEVRNNGSFREQDFQRLKMIASGGKRDEEDTTGAFGIGFIAVYQITDHPELESAGRHWTFHPERGGIHQRLISNVPGTRFHFRWAKTNTDLRQALGVAEVNDETPGELLGVLNETLPLCFCS